MSVVPLRCLFVPEIMHGWVGKLKRLNMTYIVLVWRKTQTNKVASFPSLRNVGCSNQVSLIAWNNARKGTRGLPPPGKLGRHHLTYTVLVWCKTQTIKQTYPFPKLNIWNGLIHLSILTRPLIILREISNSAHHDRTHPMSDGTKVPSKVPSDLVSHCLYGLESVTASRLRVWILYEHVQIIFA
jgi:hypothetical protein